MSEAKPSGFFQPGVLYVGPPEPPRCPVHKGPMRFELPMDRFTCAGWDGEGCGEMVRAEDFFTAVGTIAEPAEVIVRHPAFDGLRP